MLNKVDKEIISKINILSDHDDCLDVVVLCGKGKCVKDKLLQFAMNNNIVHLPIINGFAFLTKYKNVKDIARLKCVTHIASVSNVCSLVYNAKKSIGVETLPIGKYNNHSCVVIDTGIYPHIDFTLGKNRIIKFVDLINNKDIPYDDNGHGTFVSGVFLGNSITSKHSGIDNNSNVIVIKALDNTGETSSIKILEAMQWVLDNKEKFNIKVVCMSFGSVPTSDNDPLMFGAEVLWDNGIVVVSAAGNDGPDFNTIMSPGASKKIITIGSFYIDEKGKYAVANFSSRGPAFGYYKPDILAPGIDIVSTNVFDGVNFYTVMSGTSVSAPIVAGVVSLLLKINPKYTPNEIKYMLLNSCVRIGVDRNSEGYGRLELANLKLIQGKRLH